MEMTLDYLPHSRLKLYQRKDHFRINTDTHALSLFMKIRENDVVLDIGTNNGALLLEASVYRPKKLIGVDICEEAIEVAKLNMAYHKLENVDLHATPIQNYHGKKVDVIISNPPYFVQPSKELRSQQSQMESARFQTTLTIDDLFESIGRNLKKEGRIYLVFRADYLHELIISASHHGLFLQRMQTVEDCRRATVSTMCLQFGYKRRATLIEKSLKIGECE